MYATTVSLRKQVLMHYASGTVDRIARGQSADAAGAGQTLHMHSPDGSTFLQEMKSLTPTWKHDIISKIWLWYACLHEENSWQISSWSDLKLQSLRPCLKIIASQQNNRISSDVGSVPDPKRYIIMLNSHFTCPYFVNFTFLSARVLLVNRKGIWPLVQQLPKVNLLCTSLT